MWWVDALKFGATLIPFDSILIRPRNRAKDFKALAETLRQQEEAQGYPKLPPEAAATLPQDAATTTAAEQSTDVVAIQAPQPPKNTAVAPSGGLVVRTGVDAQRMLWQDALIRGELWLLEGHLKNGCVGCGGDVECCWKHSTNLMDAARETQSMTTDEIYALAADLGERILPQVHPEDVKTGRYADKYPALVVEVSGLRTRFDARVMAKAPPPLTLEEAKTAAAGAAAAEVERRWQAGGNPRTYGPPETAPPEVKAIWDKALKQAQQKYPLGNPALVSEAKRAGVSEAEAQQMIAHEEYILERRRFLESLETLAVEEEQGEREAENEGA